MGQNTLTLRATVLVAGGLEGRRHQPRHLLAKVHLVAEAWFDASVLAVEHVRQHIRLVNGHDDVRVVQRRRHLVPFPNFAHELAEVDLDVDEGGVLVHGPRLRHIVRPAVLVLLADGLGVVEDGQVGQACDGTK